MMDQLFIVGTGSHARKIFHYAVALRQTVAGFVDENVTAVSPVVGVPVTHPATLGRATKGQAIFVAVGHPDVRKRLMDKFSSLGWALPALVHPSAWVAPDALLEAGVLVAAGAVVETACSIGRGAIVDIGAVVDHDCRIGALYHVKPGEVLASGTIVPPVGV